MLKHTTKLALFLLLPFLFLSTSISAGMVKGIYVTQYNMEKTDFANYLIKNAKKSGIDTFVVDLEVPSQQLKKNLALLKENNITYIARIVVFSDGGSKDQVMNKNIWEKKFNLIRQAIAYGASQIQLDYIRYNTKQKPSAKNAQDVAQVIQWFKGQLASHNIPLQVDVFGIASFGPEHHIGQDLQLISKNVDAICPMVYPSHYEPYLHHAERPYYTVYDSLQSIRAQFNNKLNFKLYPYIELSNYRYPLSQTKKMAYIRAQIKAVEDSGADGWYAWSANNQYGNLFKLLQTTKVK